NGCGVSNPHTHTQLTAQAKNADILWVSKLLSKTLSRVTLDQESKLVTLSGVPILDHSPCVQSAGHRAQTALFGSHIVREQPTTDFEAVHAEEVVPSHFRKTMASIEPDEVKQWRQGLCLEEQRVGPNSHDVRTIEALRCFRR